jgi:hypothetical protein
MSGLQRSYPSVHVPVRGKMCADRVHLRQESRESCRIRVSPAAELRDSSGEFSRVSLSARCRTTLGFWQCKTRSFWFQFAVTLVLFFACTILPVVMWWTWFGARRRSE